MATSIAVCLEVGSKKVFASALDWPGWSRSGRTEQAALAALADYASRYREVTTRAGLRLPARPVLSVAETVAGNATTDFGAPAMSAEAERRALTRTAAGRQAALLRAAWDLLDEAAVITPDELRKGPRGGGRDRDAMLDHVLGAEAGYARKIGVRHRQPALADRSAIEALRAEIGEVLGQPSDGAPLTPTGWTSRYAARRIAWHVLDHLWEMQDRVP